MNTYGDEIKFDGNGDPVAMYNLISWQLTPGGEMEFVTVGKFDETITAGGKKLHIQERNIVWNGNQTKVRKIYIIKDILTIAYNSVSLM